MEALPDDPLCGEHAHKLRYYPTVTQDTPTLPGVRTGRITDNLTSGRVFEDLGLTPIMPATDRGMVCGSLEFNLDIKEILEGCGLREGANSDPAEYVVEKAFVG